MENKLSATDPSRGLFVLCSAAFLVPFMGSSLNLALPEIGRQFDMKAVTLTWMATAYLISTAIFQIPFARVADIVGRKKIFIWGIVLFSVCTIASGFAWDEGSMISLRFLSGIGSAMMFGTNIAILTSLFPGPQRGKALGINAAVVYAALAVGPFAGGMLTHYLGWRSIFFVTGLVSILVLILSLTFIKDEWKEAKGEKFDYRGSILYGLGLAAVIYGFTTLPKLQAVIILTAGIIAFTGFIFYERNHPYPVFNVRLFKGNRVFTLSSAAALINYAATSGIAFMLSLYLQYIKGFDASHAGLILISQACVQSVFSLIAGGLSTRFSPSRTATAGMIIIVIGLAGLITLNPSTPIWHLISILVLLGIGFGIFSAPNTNVIMGSVDKSQYTQASATTGTVRLTGQAFSLGIAGMAISFHLGDNSITEDLYGAFMSGMRMTFIIFIILCLLGVYASSARSSSR